jgi:hypothetical protein
MNKNNYKIQCKILQKVDRKSNCIYLQKIKTLALIIKYDKINIILKLKEMEVMKKKRFIGVLSLSLTLLVSAGVTQAAPWTYFVRHVGAFNGSSYTDYQTKQYSGGKVILNMDEVESSYTVDVRVQHYNGSGTGWVQSVTDNETIQWSSPYTSGNKERLQFSNDLTTPVQVTINGDWTNN